MDIETLLRLRCAPFYKKLLAHLGKIVFLYNDTKPGWSGESSFYLFKCPNKGCINHKRLAIDYVHGFSNSNERVTCLVCGTNKYFRISWKHIFGELWLLIKLRIKHKRSLPADDSNRDSNCA